MQSVTTRPRSGSWVRPSGRGAKMPDFPPVAGVVIVVLLAALAAPGSGQAIPAISARTYTAGTATVIVKGSFTIHEDVPINVQASMSDGEMTWLQFGVSGSDKLDVLITFAEKREIGVAIGRRKIIAIGGIVSGQKTECSGNAEVTATLISGEYQCHGVTSHDPATGKLGMVDMTVTFTARS